MQKHRLIKATLALCLLLGGAVHAQTNATYLNIRNMPASTPGTLDYLIYGKASGTNYYWNRIYVTDFYTAFTNAPAGQTIWALLTGHTASIAANATANTATSNTLSALITANTAANSSTSNTLAASITAALAADVATSNALSARVTAANAQDTATSNSISATATAIAAAAVSTYAATGVTNGGTATLTNLYYSVLNLGNVDASSGTGGYVVNLAAASFQMVTLTNHSASYMSITGMAPGQSVNVVVKNGYTAVETFYYPPGTVQLSTSATTCSIGAGKSIALSFLVVGANFLTNVLQSVGIQQN